MRRQPRLTPALEALWRERVDLVAADLRSPRQDDCSLLEALVTQSPGMPVLVVSQENRLAAMREALGREPHRLVLTGPLGRSGATAALAQVLAEQPDTDSRQVV